MSRNPSDLRYAQTHEWVDVEVIDGESIATIGISQFAIEQLNDLVYMDLPEAGRQLSAGDEFGEVESVKAVSPLYSPVSGEVVAIHSELPDKLESLNEDPYDFGWIMKVKLSEGVPESLMNYADYEKQCGEAG